MVTQKKNTPSNALYIEKQENTDEWKDIHLSPHKGLPPFNTPKICKFYRQIRNIKHI